MQPLGAPRMVDADLIFVLPCKVVAAEGIAHFCHDFVHRQCAYLVCGKERVHVRLHIGLLVDLVPLRLRNKAAVDLEHHDRDAQETDQSAERIRNIGVAAVE